MASGFATVVVSEVEKAHCFNLVTFISNMLCVCDFLYTTNLSFVGVMTDISDFALSVCRILRL